MIPLFLLFTLLSLVVVTRQRARIARLEANNARLRLTVNMLVREQWQWQRPPRILDHRQFEVRQPAGDRVVR